MRLLWDGTPAAKGNPAEYQLMLKVGGDHHIDIQSWLASYAYNTHILEESKCASWTTGTHRECASGICASVSRRGATSAAAIAYPKDLKDAGLTRAIISIDTLNEQQNLFITRRGFHADTLRSIERSVELLPTLTKISCVTMRDTLEELPAFVAYAQDLNNRDWPGQLAIKLNQFFPSNPAQLGDEGEKFWKEQFVDEQTILAALAKAGDLKPIPRETIEGDNPSYNYYEIGDTGVNVAVLAMFSWNYPCGGCWKLRISPNGFATICISQKNPPVLWGMSLDEKRETFKRLTGYRDSDQFDIDNPNRRHYRDQLGELRFDKVVGQEKPIAHFKTILTREQMEAGAPET